MCALVTGGQRCALPLPMFQFIESSVFARYVHDYLTEDEYAALQWYLSEHPEAGDLVPGSGGCRKLRWGMADRSEEHTSELQSLMRNSYAVFCLKKKNNTP